MSDVILQAAIKAQADLLNQRIQAADGVTVDYFKTPQVIGTPYTSVPIGMTPAFQGGGQGIPTDCGIISSVNPQIVDTWRRVLTPNVNVGASGIKVCDPSGNFRCDSNCSWTVPAGVTRAQFQLWGPGGGTGQNCCCGGSPFGPSGAYTVVRLNVTAGEVYCLCSGCAFCCLASQTTPGLCGTPSFVCGPGLNVCVDSGISCYNYWGSDLCTVCLGDSCCGIPNPGQCRCSPNGCSGWSFCWDSGDDEVIVCHAFSRATWKYTCASPTRNLVCYGLNGLWPFMKVGVNNLECMTCSISTPVFGFENCTCVHQWSNVTCNGCVRRAADGVMQIPGAGGYANSVFGGCNSCGGDHGRMGMVCVSWGTGVSVN
jgi:hypothetical protein